MDDEHRLGPARNGSGHRQPEPIIADKTTGSGPAMQPPAPCWFRPRRFAARDVRRQHAAWRRFALPRRSHDRKPYDHQLGREQYGTELDVHRTFQVGGTILMSGGRIVRVDPATGNRTLAPTRAGSRARAEFSRLAPSRARTCLCASTNASMLNVDTTTATGP